MHPAQGALEWVLSALATWGYLIVFLGTMLENLFIVGSFTPGDLIVAAAAFTATTPQGKGVALWIVFACAVAGSLIGSNISYLVGRRGGPELIERVGPRFGVKAETIDAAEQYFFKRGSETVLFARFIAVMKNVVPALAGASRMQLFWFELYSTVGAVTYAGILVVIGWFLGENFRRGLALFGAFSWTLLLLVFVGGGLLLLAKRRRDKRLIHRLDVEHDAIEAAEAHEPAEDADVEA